MLIPEVKAIKMAGISEELLIKIALVNKLSEARQLVKEQKNPIILLDKYGKNGKPCLFVCRNLVEKIDETMQNLYALAAVYNTSSEFDLQSVVRDEKKALLPNISDREQTTCYITPGAFADMLSKLQSFRESSQEDEFQHVV